jgi:hypothetical protein
VTGGIKILAVLVTVGAAIFLALTASEGPKSSTGLSGTDFGLPAELKAPAGSQGGAKAKAPAAPAEPADEASAKKSPSTRADEPSGRPDRAQARPEKEQLTAAAPTGPPPTPPAEKKPERPVTPNAEEVARSAVTGLSRERVAARARLTRAKTAEGQSKAARSLERSYRTATSRIAAIRPANGRAEYASLAAALRRTANAYGGLAAAIMAGDQRGYDVQRRAVIDGENASQDAANAIFG